MSKHVGRIAGVAVLAISAFGAVAVGGVPASASQTGTILNAGAPDAIPGSYVVAFKDGVVARAGRATDAAATRAVDTKVASVAARYGVTTVTQRYRSALTGFAARMTGDQARRMAADPDVAAVEQDTMMTASTEQPNPPAWGLDRIDQANLPLNTRFGYPDGGGRGVHVYVIDTGIRTTHAQFGGRATHGFDAIDGALPADDCIGHGTHVAGTIGGGTFGVAKQASLVAVRVLGCDGRGPVSAVAAGVDWVTANAVKPAVANMSLGGGASSLIDTAVENSVESGVNYALAAGNENQNACSRSPARVGVGLTVGATTRTDSRASFSNYGECVDIFAPGVDITSAWHVNDSDTNTISGTSMAAPHVAGVAALVLQVYPSMGTAQMHGDLKATATAGKVTSPGSGSPNLLLRVTHGPVVGLAGKCLEVRGGGTANGTAVQLATCNGSAAQEWYATSSVLQNPSSGRCLDAGPASATGTEPAQIFTCDTDSSISRAQAWRWSPERKELFLRGAPGESARCLDVTGGNPADGTRVQALTCNNTAGQDWNLPTT